MGKAGRKSFGGWALVGCASLAVVVMCAALLGAYGYGDVGWRAVVRTTARTSFLCFVCAFVARALHSVWPTRASLWLSVNQPHLYASFAASHLVHAAAIFALAAATGGESLEGRGAATIIGGGGSVAYLFIALAAAPAFPRAAAFVESHQRVSAVRAFGLYYVWVIFMFSYGGRAVQSSFYQPFALTLIAALALRVIALRRAHTRAGSSADAAAF
jgi:hypothetical protein